MRLTRRNPDGNFEAVLNLFYVKDGVTWVLGGGPAPDYPDIKLDDWIRGVFRKFCPDLEIDKLNDDDLSSAMAEMMIFEDMDSIEYLVALFYNAAWAFSLLNAKLMEYEDTGLKPEDVNELKFRMEQLEK